VREIFQKFLNRIKILGTGIDYSISELGVADKLLAFMARVERPWDDKFWFSFDYTTFETGPAR
jgi:hypothetical protein